MIYNLKKSEVSLYYVQSNCFIFINQDQLFLLGFEGLLAEKVNAISEIIK